MKPKTSPERDAKVPFEMKCRIAGTVYTAVLTPDLVVGGYTIEVPQLPGVVTEADTIPEAKRMVQDVVKLWLAAVSEKSDRNPC